MEAVAELQRLVGLTNNSEVKKLLTQQINKLTTEVAAAVEIQVPDVVNPESAPKKAAPAPLKPKAKWVKISQYSWDQSDKLLKFYLRGIKNVESADNVKIEIERCNLKVIVTDGSGKDHVLDLKELFGDISGTVKPTIKVKSDYIYVSVTKDYPKSNWDALTVSDSEKAKRKEADQAAAKDSAGGADPQKGMMDMMKKMYDEGDDNMKQMMNKAYETKGKDGGAGGMGGMADMMGGMGGMAGGPPSGGMGMGGAGGAGGMGGMADMLKNMGGAGGAGGADPAGGPPGGMDMAAMMKMLGGAGGAGGAEGADGAKDPMAGMADMLKMMGGGAGGAPGGAGGMDMAEMMKNMGGAGGMADMLKGMGGADGKNDDLGVEEIE